MQARLLTSHDCILTLVPLIAAPPWQRRRTQNESKLVSTATGGTVAPSNHPMSAVKRTLPSSVTICPVF
jgi:hypothetical protein